MFRKGLKGVLHPFRPYLCFPDAQCLQSRGSRQEDVIAVPADVARVGDAERAVGRVGRVRAHRQRREGAEAEGGDGTARELYPKGNSIDLHGCSLRSIRKPS